MYHNSMDNPNLPPTHRLVATDEYCVGSVLPPALENEVQYYIYNIFLHHGTRFQEIVANCDTNYFGKPNGGLRTRVGRRINNIKKQLNNSKGKLKVKKVSAVDAPQVSSAHRLLHPNDFKNNMSDSDNSFSEESASSTSSEERHRMRANNLRSNNNYNNNFGARVQTPHVHQRKGRSLTPPKKSNSHSTSLNYNKTFALSLLPSNSPISIDCTLVKQCLDKDGVYTYDKLVLILQLTDVESLKCLKARLANDGTSIIVEMPIKTR